MIIVITGPTGVGKTKLSIQLAKIYNGEIINADSMQIYEGMNVGTAKVTKEEKRGVVHHLLDIRKIDEEYSVFSYQRDCRAKIKEIKEKNKIPIIIGGTGLYIKAALYDYQFSEEEEKDNPFEEFSNEELYSEIIKYDKEIDIDRNNRRRLVRTLNKIRKETMLESQNPKEFYNDIFWIGLTTDTQELYTLIDKRVDKMLLDLVDEVKTLYERNKDSKALQTAIGYKELIEFFENKTTFKECIKAIKKNSRNYAKRQYTFLKNQLNVKWFSVNYENFSKTIDEIVNYIEQKKNLN